MENKLVDLLKKSATLIVPSRRLGATLQAKANDIFAQSQLRWDTPRIFALEDWFQALWDQFEISGIVTSLLLTPTQSVLHFENIIVRSESGKGLLRQHQAAKTAFQAWHDLHYWQCSKVIFKPPENCDQAAFQAWAKEYQLWLEKNQFIDNAKLPQVLLSLFMEEKHRTIISKVSPLPILILYGFEEMAPIIDYFFKSLATKAWQIYHEEPYKIIPKNRVRISFLQQEQEWMSAATWAKALIEQGESNIAIVVPNLPDVRSKLDTIFKDTFDPFHLLNPTLRVCHHFNISAAIPLIQYPIILEALSLLKLGLFTSIEEIEVLLTSPFTFGAKDEKFARSQLLKQVHALKSKGSLNSLMQLIDNHPDISMPKLRDIILKLINLLKDLPYKQSYGEWVHTFKKILSFVGWPGERPLNSVEYQLVQRVDALFEELGLCDIIIEEYPPYHQALTTLEKLSANIPFQAENKNAKIQVLGLLEAQGNTYNHLWVMGMHSEAWPPPPTPNPFIPIDLQRQLQMPHADQKRELQYARNITQRFKESAQEIIFSYPMKDKEKKLIVSELIQDIPLTTICMGEPIRCENYFNKNEDFLETVEDQKAPFLEERGHHSSNTLTLQATCPFKAFAEIRLNLIQDQKPSVWLGPKEQGILVHQLLAEFWRTMKTQAALLNLTQEALFSLTRQLIENHLKKIAAQTPSPYLEVEKSRLTAILLAYFQLEKKRDPFKVVYIERQQNYELAQMNFRLRIDRIDETSQGDYILIDYKTGKFDLSTLFNDRLSAQLPLYFLANKHLKLKALMVIKLNTMEATFQSISEQNIIERSDILWSDLSLYWENKLKHLVQDFKEGNAAVDPLSFQHCRYCHLKPLCRINERQSHE